MKLWPNSPSVLVEPFQRGLEFVVDPARFEAALGLRVLAREEEERGMADWRREAVEVVVDDIGEETVRAKEGGGRRESRGLLAGVDMEKGERGMWEPPEDLREPMPRPREGERRRMGDARATEEAGDVPGVDFPEEC